MAGKADFTEAEWTRLKRGPFIAGMAISLADPGGPIEAVKETSATLKTVTGAEDGSRGPFVGASAGEAIGGAREHKNPLHDFKPMGSLTGRQTLDKLTAVSPIVS